LPSLGIRHVHLLVADLARSTAFYAEAFGMEEQFRDGEIVFMGTPGGGDSLALHLAAADDERARVGTRGGCEHFGIHLQDRSPAGVDRAVELVKKAGGCLLDRGEHAPGVPYAYVADVDGYAIEI
jgi:catechol 2,3-dioxygenase-like lactoylglutathione lyase family enzyme